MNTSWGEMGWTPAGGYFVGGECGQGAMFESRNRFPAHSGPDCFSQESRIDWMTQFGNLGNQKEVVHVKGRFGMGDGYNLQ